MNEKMFTSNIYNDVHISYGLIEPTTVFSNFPFFQQTLILTLKIQQSFQLCSIIFFIKEAIDHTMGGFPANCGLGHEDNSPQTV